MAGSSSSAFSASEISSSSESSFDEDDNRDTETHRMPSTPIPQASTRHPKMQTPGSQTRSRTRHFELENASSTRQTGSPSRPHALDAPSHATRTGASPYERHSRHLGNLSAESDLSEDSQARADRQLSQDSLATYRETTRRATAKSSRLSTSTLPLRSDEMNGSAPDDGSHHGGPSVLPSSRKRRGQSVSKRRSRRSKVNGVDDHKMYGAEDMPFEVPAPFRSFPTYKGCVRFDGFSKQQEPQQFFDCKFYPYNEPGVDPVFAVVGGSKLIVARPATSGKEPIEVILWMNEELTSSPGRSANHRSDSTRSKHTSKQTTAKETETAAATSAESATEESELNSCVWMTEPKDGLPYLAVSGKPSDIKLINVTAKRLERTLIGHGKEVNDLAVSPIDPSILASASGDHTVRIWSIDPRYAKQPCIAMCAGEGHRQGLLTLAFHAKGRYLLTGGVDCAVCLWVLPPLPDERSGTDKPTMIHYPHFKNTAMHMSFVDCVAFHHDLILSKSAMEDKIVLWRIEGFDSREPPPAKAPIGSDGTTLSAFGGKYQRLIQFSVPDTSSFYIRFSLFNYPNQRPILAVGNEKSKVFFWDMDAMSEYERMTGATDALSANATRTNGQAGRSGQVKKRSGKGGGGGGGGGGQQPGSSRQESIVSESSNAKSDGVQAGLPSMDGLGLSSSVGRQKLEDRYRMNDPFDMLEPHKVSIVNKVNFACRQVAWSVAGEHMVVVGDQGMIGLFGRSLNWHSRDD